MHKLAFLIWIIVDGMLPMTTANAAFVVQDIEVCAAKYNVRDPEFDSQGQSMTFMNGQVQVRVTSMLPDGTVGAQGCVGAHIDQAAWGWPNGPAAQGPEWARSQMGLEIFYNRFLADGVTPALARAWRTGTGWHTEFLAQGDGRATIITSHENNDPQARLAYLLKSQDGSSTPMWRDAADPTTERAFEAVVSATTGSAPRWIPGERALSLAQFDANGIAQAVRYWVDTQTSEMLTADAGNKGDVWMWSAPEFNGDRVFITVVDGCCLRVYRQQGDAWTLINTINSIEITGLSMIFSPEIQTYKGKSYVAFQVGNSIRDLASAIWVVGIDPSKPFARRVSDSSAAVRFEPEWLVTKQGVFVYYTQAVGAARTLRRAATGL
jgi:hypothetical protein